MRRERMVGDLALEFWCPPARNGRVARRAVSLRGEPSNDLKPEAHLIQAANGFEDRSDTAAELVVMAIVEALEIDFVEVNPGADVFEHLWRAIAVRDERRNQASGLGLFEDGYRPFGGDEGFIVSADENFAALAKGVLDQFFR